MYTFFDRVHNCRSLCGPLNRYNIRARFFDKNDPLVPISFFRYPPQWVWLS